MLIHNDPNNAWPKLSTVNPSTKEATKKNINAFITKENKPSVISVIGKVRIKSIGLIKIFNTPNTSAAIKAG